MKTKSVFKKLGRFKSVGLNGAIYFYSRRENNGNRMVKVIKQDNGRCVALPMFDTPEEKVVFHAKTIKSLVEFLEAV